MFQGLVGSCSSSASSVNVVVQNTAVFGTSDAVGGIFGYFWGNIQNTHQLGFLSGPNVAIVNTTAQSFSGGLVGQCYCCCISQSGVVGGTVFSPNGFIVGAVVGYNQVGKSSSFDQIYSRPSVTVVGGDVGGLFGNFEFFNGVNNSVVRISNVYSRATLEPLYYSAGFIDALSFGSGTNNSLYLNDSYFSCSSSGSLFDPLVSQTTAINSTDTLSFHNVFYNNQTSLSSPSVKTTDATFAVGLPCSVLLSTINSTFDQVNTWNGARLRVEKDLTYFDINFCSQILTSLPTTQIPTTKTPTFTPTLFASTTQSLTNSPSSEKPSTSPILLPTNTPSTFGCFYQVKNCQNCPLNAPLFDLTEGLVSCVLSQQQIWTWIFTPNNGTLTNNGEIVLTGNVTTLVEGNLNNNASLNISSGSSIVVQGNFTQNSGGQIVFTFNPSSSQNNNKTVPLNVGGCVSINGNISLNLQTQPQQGTTNLQVISYNCTQQVNISSSQIQVNPNYNGSSCDTINSQAINQQGSLGISLTSTLGNKCNGGKNLGLIIGLAVGIPCGIIIIGVSIYISKLIKRREYAQSIHNLGKEMQSALKNGL